MYKFKHISMKPMIFKNMSSNFLPYTLSPVGLTGMYPVEQFAHENRGVEKSVLRFAKLTPEGELLWSPKLPKNRCCVCRRCLPSSLSAKVHGGQDARAVVFPGPSKSALAPQLGEGQILSRSVKRFSKARPRNDPKRGTFVFRNSAAFFPISLVGDGPQPCLCFSGMPRGP